MTELHDYILTILITLVPIVLYIRMREGMSTRRKVLWGCLVIPFVFERLYFIKGHASILSQFIHIYDIFVYLISIIPVFIYFKVRERMNTVTKSVSVCFIIFWFLLTFSFMIYLLIGFSEGKRLNCEEYTDTTSCSNSKVFHVEQSEGAE